MSTEQPPDFDTDVYSLLVRVCVNTQNNELVLDQVSSNGAQKKALAAADAIKAGDDLLTTCAEAMSGLTSDKLTRAEASMQALQTKVSNINQNYSTVNDASSTIDSNLSQAQGQQMGVTQSALDGKNSQTSLLMTWAS